VTSRPDRPLPFLKQEQKKQIPQQEVGGKKRSTEIVNYTSPSFNNQKTLLLNLKLIISFKVKGLFIFLALCLRGHRKRQDKKKICLLCTNE